MRNWSSGPVSSMPANAMPGDLFYDVNSGDTYIFWNTAWRKLPQDSDDPKNYLTATDYATASKGGAVKVGDGLSISSGKLKVAAATSEKVGGIIPGTGLAMGEGGALNLQSATAGAIGGVGLVANQTASTASDVAGLVTDFNTLLTALKAAGVMAADAEG